MNKNIPQHTVITLLHPIRPGKDASKALSLLSGDPKTQEVMSSKTMTFLGMIVKCTQNHALNKGLGNSPGIPRTDTWHPPLMTTMIISLIVARYLLITA